MVHKKENKSQKEIEIKPTPFNSIHSTEVYLNPTKKVSQEQKILNIVFIILCVIFGLGTLISYIYAFGISFGTFYPYRHLTFPLFLATMITLALAFLTSYNDEPKTKIGGINLKDVTSKKRNYILKDGPSKMYCDNCGTSIDLNNLFCKSVERKFRYRTLSFYSLH